MTAWENNQTCVSFYTRGSTEVIFWGYWYCLELCRVVCLLKWLKGRAGLKKEMGKVCQQLAVHLVSTHLRWKLVIGLKHVDNNDWSRPLSAPSSFCKYCNFWYPFSRQHATRHLAWFQGWGSLRFFGLVFNLVTSTFLYFVFSCIFIRLGFACNRAIAIKKCQGILESESCACDFSCLVWCNIAVDTLRPQFFHLSCILVDSCCTLLAKKKIFRVKQQLGNILIYNPLVNWVTFAKLLLFIYYFLKQNN